MPRQRKERKPKPKTEFLPAPEVEEIARQLIAKHHPHLVEAKIGYLFRTGPWVTKGQQKYGHAHKPGPRDRQLTGLDFVVVIGRESWDRFTPEQRMAAVDHELAHCGCEDRKDGSRAWVIWPHDLEEFTAIVKRHGLWTYNAIQFGRVAAEAHQMQFEFPRAAGQ